jgi:DNA invertase Pin-like site-specific DNA recombinase
LIAKLDRLARNVHFVSGLLERGVDFVAADVLQANKVTIQMHAVMAEWERDPISARTKAALAAARMMARSRSQRAMVAELSCLALRPREVASGRGCGFNGL